jgi:phage terminase large subunit
MKSLEFKLRYTPRPLQQHVHENFARFTYLVLHRRFGKSKCAAAQMLSMGLINPLPNPKYMYIAPTYKQAKNIIWEDLKIMTKELPYVSTNEAELKLTIERPDKGDKIIFMLYSAENYESILGTYSDGAVFDEWQLQNPIVYTRIIRPLLADRKGWALFLGTPRGDNHFKHMYEKAQGSPNWFVYKIGNKESKIIDDEEMASLTEGMSPEEVAQEFECSFSAPNHGSYYSHLFAEIRAKEQITSVPHDPALLVNTAWDLGIGDSTAIWFYQQNGGAIQVIDYLEDSGRGLDFYAHQLRSSLRQKYMYDTHYLPHDAAASELGTGKTRVKMLTDLGLERIQVLPRDGVDDGIQAVRALLPRVWFDKDKTYRGVTALESYGKKWDEKNKIYSSRPNHNWSSHGADAFRTLAMGLRPFTKKNDRNSLPQVADSTYDIFNATGD